MKLGDLRIDDLIDLINEGDRRIHTQFFRAQCLSVLGFRVTVDRGDRQMTVYRAGRLGLYNDKFEEYLPFVTEALAKWYYDFEVLAKSYYSKEGQEVAFICMVRSCVSEKLVTIVSKRVPAKKSVAELLLMLLHAAPKPLAA